MKTSLRARRMARHQGRMKTGSKLNLVSLMDIFTILVFFLLLNSGDVEVLQKDKSITLPESVAQKKPDATLLVMVNDTDLLVAGRAMAKVKDILALDGLTIPELEQELKHQAARRPNLTESEQEKGRAVTIMGDQSIPYALLKRIMSTCAANDYRNISLAVNQVARAESLASAQES
jgi:biopolymer transport protein ExbD